MVVCVPWPQLGKLNFPLLDYVDAQRRKRCGAELRAYIASLNPRAARRAALGGAPPPSAAASGWNAASAAASSSSGSAAGASDGARSGDADSWEEVEGGSTDGTADAHAAVAAGGAAAGSGSQGAAPRNASADHDVIMHDADGGDAGCDQGGAEASDSHAGSEGDGGAARPQEPRLRQEGVTAPIRRATVASLLAMAPEAVALLGTAPHMAPPGQPAPAPEAAPAGMPGTSGLRDLARQLVGEAQAECGLGGRELFWGETGELGDAVLRRDALLVRQLRDKHYQVSGADSVEL